MNLKHFGFIIKEYQITQQKALKHYGLSIISNEFL